MAVGFGLEMYDDMVNQAKNWAEDLTTDVGQAISSGLGF